MTAPILRPYQVDAIEQMRLRIQAGKRRLLLVAPTGSGKTVIAAEIIRRMRALGKSALFVAGARELIHQTSSKLNDIDVGHGVIMPGYPAKQSDVMVASIQTLNRRGQKPVADLVIIDEADLARAAMYEALLEHYSGAVILGLTATPWRGDGKGLGAGIKIGEAVVPMFEDGFVVATPKQLMAEGHLVPVDLERSFAFEPPDMSGVKITGGDYDEKQVAEWSRSSTGKKLSGNVVTEYVNRGDGERAVCFGTNVETSKQLCQLFLDAGVKAEHVDGTTPRDERAGIFSRIRSGVTRVLCNVGVVTRGVDIPPLTIAILARPTKSLSLYLQMVGRCMRPSPGKTGMRIFDHAGLIEKEGHGLPDDERDYSLGADVVRSKKKAGDLVVLRKRCPSCMRMPPPGPVCAFCGVPFPVAASQKLAFDETAEARSLAESAGERVKDHGPGARKVQVAMLAHLLEQAESKAWKPKAVEVKFKLRWGFWPPFDLMREARALGKMVAA